MLEGGSRSQAATTATVDFAQSVLGGIIQLGWLTTGGPRGAQDQAFPQTERLIPGQA